MCSNNSSPDAYKYCFSTLLGTIMYRMISIASFNQTYRLIHSYATFFASLHSRQYTCTSFFRTTIHVHLCICAESCHRASARTKYTQKNHLLKVKARRTGDACHLCSSCRVSTTTWGWRWALGIRCPRRRRRC